jgi:membrane protease YdiL (CAAX protease family)
MTEHPAHPNPATPPVVARPIGAPPLAPSPPELELPHVRRGAALLDLGLVLLTAIVLPYIPGLLAPWAEPSAAPAGVGPLVILEVWCQAGLAVGLLLYFVLRQRIRPTAFGLRRDRIADQLLWGVGTLIGVYVALVASIVVIIGLCLLVPGLEEDLTRRLPFAKKMPVERLGTTLTLLVAVAIHEEVIFRGLLLPYLRRVSRSWVWAVLISSAIFAGLHVPQQGLLAGIQILAISAALAVCFVLSRSLLAVTLAHLLFNFLQFQLIRVLPDPQELLERLEG